MFRRASVLGLPGASDVVYLQDHLDYLSSEQDLLLLANQGLDHMLLLHVYRGKEGRGKKKKEFNKSLCFNIEVQCCHLQRW